MIKTLHTTSIYSFFLTVFFFFLTLPSLSAQDCDCIGCPLQITDNGTFQVFLDVNIDGPNDLGSCQLEQVCFTISHTWVGDLAATLTSPSGLNYIIMGDSNNGPGGCGTNADNIDVCITTGTGNPLTNNTQYACNGANPCLQGNWTAPCGGVTDPVTGAVQAPGCDLAAFNVPGDPVNGTWTLTVNDICGQDQGPLEDWSLVFSCPTLECITCIPEGGSLPSSSFSICDGDANLSIPPNGEQTDPDYGYTYVISEGGIVVDVIDGPDLTGFPPGDYEVCGFSYSLGSSGELSSLIGESLSSLQADFLDPDPPFCADFSTNCVDVAIGEPPFVEIDGPDFVCENAEVEISVVGGPFADIDWSGTSSSSPSIMVEAGTYSVTVVDDQGCESTADITIDELPAPEPQIFGPDILCVGGDGVLELDQPYETYFWSNNEETEQIIITEADGYSVTVTDSDGCEGIAVFSIGMADPVDVEITGDLAICDGGSATLDAGPQFDTYEWSTGEPFQDIFVSDPDTYSVTVTDFNGCEGTDEVELELIDSPEPEITGPEFLCSGEQVTLSVTESFSEYEWSNSGVNNNIQIDAPGTYTVTVTNNEGCEGETSFEVLDAPAVDATISGPIAFCPDGSTTLTVTGGYDTYEWSNSQSGSSITITDPDDYQLTVTSFEGCEQILDITISEFPAPMPAIIGDDEICEGESSALILNESYQSYIWSTTQTSAGITIEDEGEYTVTVTDNNDCTAEASFNLIVNEILDVPINGPPELCPNAPNELSVVGSFQEVNWSTTVSGSNITPITGPGTYSVDIIDANGCPTSSSITVEEGEADFLEITGDLVICEGEEGQLSATAGFESYDWSNDLDTENITVSSAGTYSVFAIDADGCEAFASFDVTESPTPDAEVTGNLFFCAGTETAITITPGFASYEWSNNNTSNEIAINTPGDYSVTVTNSDDCSQVIEFTVDELTELMPVIEGFSEVCEGESAQLTIQGTYDTYNWSDGTTNPSLTVQDQDLYAVTVTDTNGCSGEGTFDFTVNPISALSINGDEQICDDSDGQLTATGGFTTYEWSNNAETASITVDDPGTYTLLATDPNGCVSTASFEVTEVSSPSPTIEGDLTVCPGFTTELTSPGTYTTYQWSNNGNNSPNSISSPGEVTLTVFDDVGCSGSVAVTVVEVPNPVPIIDGIDAVCEGESADLMVTENFASYMWSDGTTSNQINVQQTDIYSVTVTDNEGCVGEATFDFTVNQIPALEIIGNAQICTNSSGQLNATEGFTTYDWSNNETTANITVTTSGQYALVATDPNGCVATASFDVEQVAAITPIIEGDLTVCPGATTVLSTPGTYTTYEWSNNSNSNSMSTATPGEISLTVFNDIGCTGTATVTVVEVPNPTPTILGDFILCEGETSTLSVDGTYVDYQWSNTETGANTEININDIYAVTVTDEEGCQGIASQEVTLVIPTVEISGIDEFCLGNATDLSVPDDFVMYEWSTGEQGSTINTAVNGDVSIIVTDENGCTATDLISLTELPLPEVEIDGRLSFCPIGGTELTATEGYVNYIWSNSESTETIFINEENNYSVTVTDSNGCENSTSVLVIEDAELDPVIDGVPSFCEGTSTSLSVNAGYTTYEWSNDLSTSEITITEPATYIVTVTDEFGCMGTAAVEVVTLPLPEPEITGDLDYCIGSSTNLNAGSGYVTYNWSAGGIDTQNLEVTSPATYSVTVTDENDCVGFTSVDVIENPLPVTSIDGIPGFCPGTTTQLSAEDGFVNYDWSTGSSSQIIEVGTTELVSLLVTDENGCVGEAQLDVAVFDTAIPAIDGVPQYCPGEETSLTGGAGFVTYNWSTGSTENTITTGTEGTVTLIVTDDNNCETSNDIDLSPYVVVAPEITTVDGFCSGSSADLTATPGYDTYLWSNTEETASITVSTGGIYELSVIDNNGCPSEAAIAIEEYALPTPAIGGSLTYCIGTSTTLNAGADYAIYQWSDGTSESETTVMTPGSIGLTVTDVNGCIGNTAEIVTEATELSPVISGEADFCAGLSTDLSAGNGFATYNWSNGSQAPDITVTTPGTYTLEVTDLSGCSGMATIEVVENPLPTPVISGLFAYCEGLSTELSVNADYVSYNWNTDNPTTSITVNTPGNYSVTVVDSNGCINETGQSVTEQSAPVFNIMGPTDFCVDSFSVLSIEPAYATYNWSTAETTQSIEVSTSGIVGVTVTDEFGCESEGNQTLGTIPLPLADAGSLQNLDCDTDIVNIGGSGTTSGNEFTYQWSGPGINANNQTLATPDVSMPGTYTLLVTNEDYGCLSVPATVEVEDLSYTPQVIMEVLDILDCATSTVQIDARDSDEGTEFVYQWLDGNLNPIAGEDGLLIAVNTAQFYTLQILDTLTGCGSEGTIEVEENELYPIAEAGLAQLITCGDPVATLDGTASQMGGQINYLWTSPDGFSISSSTTNSASTTEPGWYFLQVTDELNGCFNIDSVFVDENTEYPLAFTSEGIELDCNVTSTLITSEGTTQGSIYSYQWLFNGNIIENATQQQINAESPGTYTLQVLNTENECMTSAFTDITINPAAPQALNFMTNTPTCAGDEDGALFLTGVEGGTPPFLYSVGGAPYTSNTNYSNLFAGDYQITVEDATGCLLLSTITVPDGNNLTLELGDDQFLKEGELADIYPEISVDSAQLVQIDWQTAANLSCEDCIYQFDIEVPESMRFFLSIQDVNGCEASDDLTIYVEKDRPIYVPTAFSPNNDGENDIFHIYSDQSVVKINSFLVFNRWGESVFEVYNSFPNDPRWGWDGNYRGLPVNAAVYVWFAEVEFSNGDVEVIKGEVSVMR